MFFLVVVRDMQVVEKERKRMTSALAAIADSPHPHGVDGPCAVLLAWIGRGFPPPPPLCQAMLQAGTVHMLAGLHGLALSVAPFCFFTANGVSQENVNEFYSARGNRIKAPRLLFCRDGESDT